MAIIRASTWTRVAKVTRWGESMMANRGPSMGDPRFNMIPDGDRWPWGISFSGKTCSIYNGILFVGDEWVYNAGPMTIDVATDGDWIGYEYDVAAETWALVCQPALPQSGEGKLRGPLYKVTKWTEGAVDYAFWTIDLAHGLTATNTYA